MRSAASPHNNDLSTKGNPPCCWNATTRQWSWLVRILPYLEQQNLYIAGGFGNNPEPLTDPAIPAIKDFIATVVPTLRCPSDTTPSTRTDTYNWPAGTVMAVTSYKGVSGGNWAWGVTTYSDPQFGTDGLNNGNGIFFRQDAKRPFGITDISDGTSNTLMVGEDIGSMNRHNAWVYSNSSNGTCGIPLNNAMVMGQPGYNDPADWPNVYSFRSRHTGGANFTVADASVRFVRDSIALVNYRNACSCAGGETTGLD